MFFFLGVVARARRLWGRVAPLGSRLAPHSVKDVVDPLSLRNERAALALLQARAPDESDGARRASPL